LLVLLAVLLSACEPSAPPPTADPATRRALPQGELVGFDAGGGIDAWLGLPYAAPPVGPLRWRAPRPAAAWTGLREALEFGSPCMQIGGPLGGVPRDRYGEIVGSEDCLTLNVWAPRERPDGGAPVMLWIHGGANTVGHGGDYDGRYLAAAENVVVVTVNYRLGLFGWFAHPAVLDGGDSPLDASGNFGLLDLVAALRWVREHIATFGGDPQRVTVFGESAGGRNILALLAAPPARGLFHAAISQSGLAAGTSLAAARNPLTAAVPGDPMSAAELAAQLLVDAGESADLDAARRRQSEDPGLGAWLRQRSATGLLELFPEAVGGLYEIPTVIEDGIVLPAQPLFASLATPGASAPVPVILGTNRDEMKLFLAVSPRYSRRILGLFYRLRDAGDFELEAAYRSRLWKAGGADEVARVLTAAGNERVWVYRFDWDEGARTIFADMSRLLGAAHGMEIPFVFGDFADLFGNTLVFDEGNRAGREALSQQMQGYWASFAREGEPSGAVAWPPWGDGRFLVFDSAADGGLRESTETESIVDLMSELAGESGFSGPEALCRTYALSFRELPVWSEAQYLAAGDGACAAFTAQDFPRY
jgi:para-nitrobenzyl esterase